MTDQIKKYLESLNWDGVNRVYTLLTDYFTVKEGSTDVKTMEYILTLTVNRLYNPGCTVPMLPILKGPQGCGKTKFIQDLTGNWYTDFNLVMKTYTKDEMEKLQRSWIIETTLETRNLPYIYYTLINEDTYRKPYQQRPGTYKRQCFFIATTNLEEIKGDWLFNVKQGPGVMNRDQIWAEIMHYFKGRPV